MLRPVIACVRRWAVSAPLNDERVAHAQVPLHPQVPQKRTLLHELRHARQIQRPPRLRVALTRRDRGLAPPPAAHRSGRRASELSPGAATSRSRRGTPRRAPQQARMQEVLGLLDADEGGGPDRRAGPRVGEHLERPVRGEARETPAGEGRVLDLEQRRPSCIGSASTRLDRRDPCDARRRAPPRAGPGAAQEELNDVGEVVAGPRRAAAAAPPRAGRGCRRSRDTETYQSVTNSRSAATRG